MKTPLAFVLVFLFVLLAAAPLLAWETDLHYGLTKWLAVKAGFGLEQAEKIALGTQGPDEGRLYPAPFAVPSYTCLARDALASRFIQEHHFPSYAALPAAPSQRPVMPGEPENGSNLWVRKELQGIFPDTPLDWSLRSFGFSLHPLQDSWSHQGVPDIPPWPCSDELSWSHPKSRGGWRSHDADLTHLHVQDTLATAKRTYAFLVDFRKRLGGEVPAAVPWSQLEPKVREFAQAATKEDKRKWFESDPQVPFSSYTYKNFLDGISLPDSSTRPISHLNAGSGVLQRASQRTSEAQGCAKDFANQVLNLWILRQDPEGLRELVDTDAMVKALLEGTESKGAEPRELVTTVFLAWLVADHGIVNELAHGLPLPGREADFYRLSKLVQVPQNRLRFETLGNAIHGPGTPEPYLLITAPPRRGVPREASPERNAVLFQFRHAPQDAVVMTIEKQPRGWRVVALDWYVD
jgi:hypothetical protein